MFNRFGLLYFTALEKFQNKQVLPVIWMEIVSGAISPELRSMIYQSTFGANVIQILLNYITLILSATSLAFLILICLYKRKDGNPAAGNMDLGSASFTSSAKPDDEKPYSADVIAGVKSEWANPHQDLNKMIEDGNVGGENVIIDVKGA